METDKCITLVTPIAPFLNFLRGMETGQRGDGVRSRDHFLNFLRGMETDH